MSTLYCADVMTKDATRVAPEASLGEVTRLMLEQQATCLVVCEENEPIGVISERDLARALARELAGEPLPENAQQAMTAPPLCAETSDSIEQAIEMVHQRGVRQIVVVDERGDLAGVVSERELVSAQRRLLEREIGQRASELEAANHRLQELAMHDGLLGIGNRRAMEIALEKTHSLASRHGRSYAVALMDVDYFKQYNDTHGHPAGDQLLRRIALHLQREARSSDTVYRYGGDELLILMPETKLHGARVAADRMRENLAALRLPHRGSPHEVVTLSVGVACSHDDADHPPLPGYRDVISHADASLYDAKRNGRNCTGATPPLPDA